MKRNQQHESLCPRTTSWTRQPEFDCLLAEYSISSLMFLEYRYETLINNYKDTHDLSNKECMDELQILKQRYKMINEEMEHRYRDMLASPTNTQSEQSLLFDSQKGVVYSNDGTPVRTIDFSEDEESFIVRDIEGSILEDTSVEEDECNYKLSKKDLYNGWDYWLNE